MEQESKFGLPYGLTDKELSKNMDGNTEEERMKNLNADGTYQVVSKECFIGEVERSIENESICS